MVRTGIPDALSGIRLLRVMGANGDGGFVGERWEGAVLPFVL